MTIKIRIEKKNNTITGTPVKIPSVKPKNEDRIKSEKVPPKSVTPKIKRPALKIGLKAITKTKAKALSGTANARQAVRKPVNSVPVKEKKPLAMTEKRFGLKRTSRGKQLEPVKAMVKDSPVRKLTAGSGVKPGLKRAADKKDLKKTASTGKNTAKPSKASSTTVKNIKPLARQLELNFPGSELLSPKKKVSAGKNQVANLKNNSGDMKANKVQGPVLSPRTAPGPVREKSKTAIQTSKNKEVMEKRQEIQTLSENISLSKKEQPETVIQAGGNLESKKRQPDRWSDCGQIFFTAGRAFGISSNLRTVYIGTEPEVQAFIQDGKPGNNLTPIQMDALTRIKEYKKYVESPEEPKEKPTAAKTVWKRKNNKATLTRKRVRKLSRR